MKAKVQRGFSVLLAAGVSAGLFYLALRDVRLKEVCALLLQIRPEWIPLLLAMPILDLLVRAVRWRLLLLPVAEASWPKLFQLEAVGLAINNIAFLRLGELARGYVTGKELEASTVSVLGTILVERLCDTVALLSLLSLSAFALPGLLGYRVGFWAAGMAAGLTLVLAALAAGDAHIRRDRPWLRALKAYPRVHLLVEELMLGARALRHAPSAAGIAVLSLSLWACDSVLFWTAARGLRFEPPLTFLRSVVVVASAAGASALPAMPGAFGNFEAFVKGILTHFGYEKGLAVGYAALVHMTMYLIVTALGILCLYRMGHTFSSLRKALEKR